MRSYVRIAVSCLAFVQAGCDREEEGSRDEVLGVEVEVVETPVADVVEVNRLEPRLLRFVPKEVEFVFDCREMKQVGVAILETVNSTDWEVGLFVERIERTLKLDEDEVLPKLEPVDEDWELVGALGNEAFFCGWDGIGETLDKLAEVVGKFDHWQVETLTKMYLNALKGESVWDIDRGEPFPDAEMVIPEEPVTVPKFLFGCQPKSQEIGGKIKERWMASMAEWLLKEELRHDRVEQNVLGSRFTGFQVGLHEEGEKAIFNEFVILFGVIDEGLFCYLGPAEEELRLPGDVADSICHHPGIDLWNEYANEGAQGLAYLSRSLVDSLAGFSTSTKYWSEIRRIFSEENPEFTQSKSISRKLDFLSAYEAIEVPRKRHSFAAVLYFEQGVHYESRGGEAIVDDPTQTPWVLPSVELLDPFLTVRFRSDEKRMLAALEYYEETFSLLGLLFREWVGPSNEKFLDEAGKAVVTVEEEFKILYRSWKNDVLAALKPEQLFLVHLLDFNGLVFEAPRAAALWPLRSRHRLKIGLEGIAGVFERMGLKLLGAMPDLKNWPAIVREEDDRTDLYRIQVSGESDAWSPTLAVNDDSLWISSSKKYLDTLMQKVSLEEVDGRSGLLIEMNLAQLMKVVEQWGKREGGEVQEFLELFEVKILREKLSRFSYWSRIEDGVPRTSVSLGFSRSN